MKLKFNIRRRNSFQSRKLSQVEELFNAKLRPLAEGFEPSITTFSGSPFAKVLMVAPPCTETEFNVGSPFSDDCAMRFRDFMRDANIDVTEHFFIVSASLGGKKPNKASTEPVKKFVKECADLNLFKAYVCVGEEAFRFVFSDGKKISMSTLIGSTVFMPETNHKPLYVFPATHRFIAPEFDNNRDQYRADKAAEEFNDTFAGWINRYVAMLNQYVVGK